ncbi:MAG: helix-turn-helix domain-containing protein [Methylophilaceae bacterium]
MPVNPRVACNRVGAKSASIQTKPIKGGAPNKSKAHFTFVACIAIVFAMDILTIGAIIRKERTACGLSQKALAEASHVSRVTIVNLERGKVGDIGAIKLAEIAENVGTPIFSSGKKMDFIKVTLGNINTSYKRSMSVSDLVALMMSGRIQPGLEGQVMHLIDETPTSLVAGAIKQLAAKKNINARQVWKNLSHVATEIKSPNKFWNAIG